MHHGLGTRGRLAAITVGLAVVALVVGLAPHALADTTAPELTVTKPERIGPFAVVDSGENGVEFAGTLTDETGGSGAATVYIEIHNTTANQILGYNCGADHIGGYPGVCPGAARTVSASTGTWSTTFKLQPGTYEAVLAGQDAAGNRDWAYIGFTVIGDPVF